MAQIFDIGNRYVQREETVHLAVELIDKIFLQGGDKTVDLLGHIFISTLTFGQASPDPKRPEDIAYQSPAPTRLV